MKAYNYDRKLDAWRKRRERILAMEGKMSIADIARKMEITPQRVGAILKAAKK